MSDRHVTRVRRMQNGECITCSAPAVGIYCDAHKRATALRCREAMRQRRGSRQRYPGARSYAGAIAEERGRSFRAKGSGVA